MSELSRTTGVPVATIKYYLREGLLPAGRAVAATQAEYDESHVQRLRLVRALLVVGGLSVAAARSVVAALEADPADVGAAVSAAHDALPPAAPPDEGRRPERALAAVELLGWDVDATSTGMRQLDAALAAVTDAGIPLGPDRLRVYARAAEEVATAEVGGMPTESPTSAVQYAIVGTVLYEPVLLALRRVAQQHVFRRLTGQI